MEGRYGIDLKIGILTNRGNTMDLQKAYKNWQENNVDEHLHMVKKRELKPKTIQLWNRKLEAWKSRKKREQEDA